MQIIQKIRDKGAAIVIAVIALSLIGFILMDAKQGSGRMFGSNSTVIGKINGENIDYNEFNKKVKLAEEQYGSHVTSSTTYQVRQTVWDQVVAEKVLGSEFEKLGLTLSPKELSSILFSENAPSSWKQLFTDKSTGQFDVLKAEQAWGQIKKAKGEERANVESEIIEPIVVQTLAGKYSGLIAAGLYYPTWMQEKDNADNKTFANISYVSVPYNIISDSAIKITDDDIADYINKHKATYKQEGGRIISYVAFSTNPSSNDTAKTLQSVADLKPSFIADTNAKVFLARNSSSIPFDDHFVLKSKLTSPHKDSITALAVNAVYGPYLDSKNFVLAKMLGSRQLADSVKCRHILIGTKDVQSGQPTLSDSVAHKRADSIAAAIAGGADFNAMVLQYSDDQGSKNKKGEYDFSASQFTGLAKEFAETIFYGNTGDKKVVHTDFGWHYIEVLNQKNFETAYKIAYFAKEILPSDETVNTASSQATKLYSEARDAKAMEAYIVKNGLKKVDVPNLVKENDYQVGGLQDARQLIKWAFDAKVGDVSEPFSVGDQFVVAVVNRIQPEGLPDPKTARPMVELIIRNLKKAELITKKLGATPTLESAAAAYNLQIAIAGADSNLVFSSQIINGVGQEPKLIGASFNKAYQNKVSEPISGTNAVYVLKVNSTGNKPVDAPDVVAQKTTDRSKSLMQQIGYGWFEALKKMADVTDNRSKYN